MAAPIIVGVFGSQLVGPLLSSIGFGTAGVTLGSSAATWQSIIGNVQTPSLFASLQSAGAGGYAAEGARWVGTSFGAAAGYLFRNSSCQG
ncbi:hypothetical protein M426DRAFT_8297 [Hypoxylon sp. CI-4A]|nr:hypothetical protein M426DRAFT_8297 [Hypoxylon sp. CI-4A]